MKVGYDIFAEPTQAGTDSGVNGVLCVETASALKHKVRVTRQQDGYYWNETNQAYESGATAEADELDFRGSFTESGSGSGNAIRRCQLRIPKLVADGATSTTVTFQVYLAGSAAATGTSIVMDFASV